MMNRKQFLAILATAAAAAAPRKRYAMVVDRARCKQEQGCTACIDACHKAHNVPSIPQPRQRVYWISKEPASRVFPHIEYAGADPLPVMCNHCDNPPCVRVCPVQATWKRDSDGIVMMDWHRCIGCRYCMAACPYGSRSFNWRDPRPHIKSIDPAFPTRTAGVVEKCNFCEERLAKGKQPACVEACPAKCLVFGDREDPTSEVSKLLRTGRALRRTPELGTGPEVHYVSL